MEDVKALLARMYPAIDFDSESRLVDGCLLDSLDLIDLMAALDKSYDVQVPAEELTAENFNSAAAIAAMVQRLRP